MAGFEFEPLALEGAWLITAAHSEDARGAFVKDYNADAFRAAGIAHELRETFYTESRRGVVRALHFQLGLQQPKLVRCVSGAVWDVVADLRPWSPTFGRWEAFELTGESRLELLVPAFFGHGYLVLEDSVVSYKCAEVFSAEGDSGVAWDDPDLAIAWPLDRVGGSDHVILSEKDRHLMSLGEYVSIVGTESPGREVR